MGGISWIHWLIYLAIISVIYVVPVVLILRKAGYSGWWVIVGFIPLINIIGKWAFALANWPRLAQAPRADPTAC